jgi:hypothetical protein
MAINVSCSAGVGPAGVRRRAGDPRSRPAIDNCNHDCDRSPMGGPPIARPRRLRAIRSRCTRADSGTPGCTGWPRPPLLWAQNQRDDHTITATNRTRPGRTKPLPAANHRDARCPSRRPPARALTIAAVLVVTATLAACTTSTPQGGTPTPEDAVSAYIAALNADDSQALRRLSREQDPALDQAVAGRLEELGGRAIHLTSRDVRSAVPHQAAAFLAGTMSGGSGRTESYRERLLLDRADRRWYIKLLPSPPPSPGGPLPTASTARPQSR